MSDLEKQASKISSNKNSNKKVHGSMFNGGRLLNAVLFCSELKMAERWFLAYLGSRIDFKSEFAHVEAVIGLDTIASRLGCSRSTVKAVVKSLTEKEYIGYIERRGDDGRDLCRGYFLTDKIFDEYITNHLEKPQIDKSKRNHATNNLVVTMSSSGDQNLTPPSVLGDQNLTPRELESDPIYSLSHSIPSLEDESTNVDSREIASEISEPDYASIKTPFDDPEDEPAAIPPTAASASASSQKKSKTKSKLNPETKSSKSVPPGFEKIEATKILQDAYKGPRSDPSDAESHQMIEFRSGKKIRFSNGAMNIAYALCQHWNSSGLNKIKLENYVKHAAAAEKLMKDHKLTPAELKAVFSWASQDDFWSKNFLSIERLTKKTYDVSKFSNMLQHYKKRRRG